MKQSITTVLLAILVIASACTKDESPKADGRLLGLNMTFNHTDPKTGETKTNAFSDYFRKEDEVSIQLESSVEIDHIDIVNSVTQTKLTTLTVNGTTAAFETGVEALNIPFGQRASLFFHVYFKDAGKEGFSYPSMKSYTFNVISEIPSIVNFIGENGTVTEIKTTDVNIQGFTEDEKKGVVATFKPGVNSYLSIEDSPLLQFGTSKNFSVSFWIQSNQDISDPAIMGTQDWNSSNNKGWIIAWLNGRLRVVTCDGAGLKNDIRENSGSMVGEDWHFVTVVFNRSTSLSIYVDGEMTATGPAVPMDLANGNTIKINQDGTGNYGDKLGSKFSMVVFHEKALSSEEITDLYNSTK